MKLLRHPFILLEIFIGITILALVIVPLSSFPYKAAKKERELFLSLEQERLAGLAFADLLDRIDAQTIEEYLDKKPLALGNYLADLSPLSTYNFQVEAILTTKNEKEAHKLIECELIFTSDDAPSLISKNRKTLLYASIDDKKSIEKK